MGSKASVQGKREKRGKKVVGKTQGGHEPDHIAQNRRKKNILMSSEKRGRSRGRRVTKTAAPKNPPKTL